MNSTSPVTYTMVGVLAIALIGLVSGCGGSGVPFVGDNFALQMVDSGTDGAGVVQTSTAVVPTAGYQGVPPDAVALRVTIGQIRVIPVDAPPIRLDMPEDTVIDVLALPSSWSLLEQDLPPGDYQKLELIVASAEMEFNDESVEPVFVPSGAQTGLKLPIEFTISDGYNTVLKLYWNTHNSVHCTGNGQWMLQPMALIVTDISQEETADTVTVTATSLAPAEVSVGATQVPMLQLDFELDDNFASIAALDVTLLGTATAADVDTVEVWVDGGDDVFNPADPGTDDASIGSAPMGDSPTTIDITDQQFSFPGTLTLFVSYDVAVAASPGTVGASIAAASDISSPDDITGAFPLESGLATIPEPPAP